MNRIFTRSLLTIAIIATTSLATVGQPAAQAGPYFNINRGYYNNGYGPGYNGYPIYGNGPYAYGSGNPYPYYTQNNYQVYGSGPYGYGSTGGYAGRYGDGSFRQYQGTAYSPYGNSVYVGPFGIGLQGFGY